MTMIMERPIIDMMVEATSISDLSNGLMSRIDRLAKLNHFCWIDQLASDGFSEGDINRLDDLVPSLLDGAEMETKLAAMIAGAQDIQDETQLESAILLWLGQMDLAGICHQACNSGFPDPIDALVSVIRYLLRLAGSAVAFEAMRRLPPEQVNDDRKIELSEVAEGIELAEVGVEEDVAEWPAY